LQVDYFYLARYIDYDIEFAAIDGHIVGGISQAASVDAAEVVGIQLIVLEGIQSERTVVQVEEPFAENVEFGCSGFDRHTVATARRSIRVFQVIARGEEKQEEEEKEGHASHTSPKEGGGIASAVIEWVHFHIAVSFDNY
jgi:hypothetical protein